MAGPRLDVDKLTLLASFGRKRRPVAAIRTGVVGQDDDAPYPRPDYILSSPGIVCAILHIQAAFKQCGFRTLIQHIVATNPETWKLDCTMCVSRRDRRHA